jgi:hypothetical protein
MCWVDDHSDESGAGGECGEFHEGALRRMRDAIDTKGWSYECAEASGSHPALAYTVGLTAYELPEFVITGMETAEAVELLDVVARGAVVGAVPRPGEHLDLGTGANFETVRLPRPWAHLHTAVEIFGPQLSALQLVHSDERGHWPWDRRFRNGAGGQPVLGPRSPE